MEPDDDLTPSDDDLPSLPPADPALTVSPQRKISLNVMAWAYVCSQYEGEASAIEQYGVTTQELKRARTALAAPGKHRRFSELVRQIDDYWRETYGAQIERAKVAAAKFIIRAAAHGEVSPGMVEAMVDAFKALTEASQTDKILDERIAASRSSRAIRPGTGEAIDSTARRIPPGD